MFPHPTIVHANGSIDFHHVYAFFCGYSPPLLITGRCNNDIKPITSGEETKDLLQYMSKYETKEEDKAYNMSALLASAIMYHDKRPQVDSLQEKNRLLVYRCFNILNRHAELSAPQVMFYLMGWGGVFCSNHYVTVYWGQLAKPIRQGDKFKNLNFLGFIIETYETQMLGEEGHTSNEEEIHERPRRALSESTCSSSYTA